MKKILSLTLIALFSTSCAHHLTQQECLTMDWHQEGVQDANQGKTPRNLMPAAQDCQKFDILVPFGKYTQGYHVGAQKYCRPSFDEGVQDGAAGQDVNFIQGRLAVCQAANVPLLLNHYYPGRTQGLKQFCTYERGQQIASEGKNLPMVCDLRLYPQFNAGWTQGRDALCNMPANGFALAKSEKPYPEMCNPMQFPMFKSEYDRGVVLMQRINWIKQQIDARNDKIGSKPFRYDLRQNPDGTYYLGNDKSSDAISMLNEVNQMVRERKHLERELFMLQMV